METLTSCPVCENQTFRPFLTCTDYTVSKKEFTIVECASCGFKFTNPRPLESDLGAYYQSEDYISHSNTRKGLISKLYQFVRNHTLKGKLKLINRLNRGPGAILDIGCGTGEFLNVCSRSGWNTIGIEPDPGARKYGSEEYKLDVREEEALKGLQEGLYDIISMWHVLEHVPRLNERIAQIKRLLKPNGHIIIAVPNCSSKDALKYGRYWAAWDVPRHLYHFTPRDLRALVGKHGMKLVQVLPMRFDSYYVSMLSEKYRTGKVRLAPAFFSGLGSNVSAGANGETWSSQIYIIQK
jgi:2-polyprenyl-3-methyl-5-hydroxy-6-metoxy-1,4-benzoquinol methylase